MSTGRADTGVTVEEVQARFGGLYRAFQYGAPPHGGMAAGIDRVVMLLVGAKNLREVTMFPMNQQAYDLLRYGVFKGKDVGQVLIECLCPSGGAFGGFKKLY